MPKMNNSLQLINHIYMLFHKAPPSRFSYILTKHI